MKSIVAYIQNRLLSFGVKHAIEQGGMATVEIVPEVQSCHSYCWTNKADIFIAEVRDVSPLKLEEWFVRMAEIKTERPNCKFIFIVDEEIYPNSAEDAKQAFKDKKVDLFFYASSGLNYVADAINSL